MTCLNKPMEIMSHLKFNVPLVRAFIKNGAHFTQGNNDDMGFLTQS
jgi:hypothetical protein